MSPRPEVSTGASVKCQPDVRISSNINTLITMRGTKNSKLCSSPLSVCERRDTNRSRQPLPSTTPLLQAGRRLGRGSTLRRNRAHSHPVVPSESAVTPPRRRPSLPVSPYAESHAVQPPSPSRDLRDRAERSSREYGCGGCACGVGGRSRRLAADFGAAAYDYTAFRGGRVV